jgi:ribulose-5-phosphate 4-epimerase/fuculose-1-phosphate aldolase
MSSVRRLMNNYFANSVSLPLFVYLVVSVSMRALLATLQVRDPLDSETFWVNPMGRSFKMMRVSDLIRVDHDGKIVEGSGILNGAAFTIHSQIHAARPDVTACGACALYLR